VIFHNGQPLLQGKSVDRSELAGDIALAGCEAVVVALALERFALWASVRLKH
jgi:hypothetical protein